MSFGAGKGSLPRAVKGEAFRKAYESIKRPEPLDVLLESFNAAVSKKDIALIESLYSQVTQHPYYRGGLLNPNEAPK